MFHCLGTSQPNFPSRIAVWWIHTCYCVTIQMDKTSWSFSSPEAMTSQLSTCYAVSSKLEQHTQFTWEVQLKRAMHYFFFSFVPSLSGRAWEGKISRRAGGVGGQEEWEGRRAQLVQTPRRLLLLLNIQPRIITQGMCISIANNHTTIGPIQWQ